MSANAKVKTKARRQVSEQEASALERQRAKAGTGESALIEGPGAVAEGIAQADYLLLGTREWAEKYAGVRAGRLVSMAEQNMRMVDREVHGLMNEFSEGLYKQFEDSPKLYEAVINVGYKADPSDVGLCSRPLWTTSSGTTQS